VKRLILPACGAALFHALFFLMPMPRAPLPPSASSPGTTITVTMTVPSYQSIATAKQVKKPEPVKEKPKKKKPQKITPRKIVKKKVAKTKQKIVTPVKEVIQPVPPDVVSEPESTNEEPVTREKAVPVVQDTETDPKESSERASAPAVGGIQSAAKPSSIYAPEPRYPKTAIRRGYQGVVLLDILVNGDGHVEKVKIKKSCGHAVLDRSAVKGVKKWRFSATGSISPVWLILPVRFELHDT